MGMMGQISGVTDDKLKELKELLTLVGDPKQTLATVEDMQKLASDIAKLTKEKQALEQSLDDKLSQAKAAEKTASEKLEKHGKLAGNLELAQKNFYDNLAKFDQQKADFEKDQKQLQLSIETQKAYVAKSTQEIEAQKAELLKQQNEALATKALHETKLAKLKQMSQAFNQEMA